MKPTTTSVSASPVRPRTGRSRTVQGPAGRAAGAQGRPFPAAQDGQPKRWPWLAGGVDGPGCSRRRHPWRPLAAALVVVTLLCSKPAAARVKTRSTSPPVTQSASTPSPAPDTAPPKLPLRQTEACVEPGSDLAPTLVVLPPGRFWMGSPAGETGRDADEGPRHWVTLPRPFALGRCEVTVGQFRRFVEATGYRTQAEQPGAQGCKVWDGVKQAWQPTPGRYWRDPGFAQGDSHPVTCVSHADAEAYLAWLSSRTGAVYRLPTEAEWEYAVRAGSETANYWGDDPQGQTQCAYANGAGLETKVIGAADWAYAACRDDFVYTAPVASLRPNAFHLYDLSGNVWEWTADCWHDSYTGAPADGSAWQETGGGDCGRRVVRGGSWFYIPRDLRSADRGRDTPDEADVNLGFRVARAL